MFRLRLSHLLTACMMLVGLAVAAQTDPPALVAIDSALARKDIRVADSILKATIQPMIEAKDPDEMYHYVTAVARVSMMKATPEEGEKRMNEYALKIKSFGPTELILSRVSLERAAFYGLLGDNKKAYAAYEEALKHAQRADNAEPNKVAKIYGNMGVIAFRMGDVNLGVAHSREALSIMKKVNVPDYQILYNISNYMGNSMWYTAKLDSAAYYFNLALDALSKSEKNPTNEFYRPAILSNNLAGVYSQQGNTTLAIKAMKDVIDRLRKYLLTKDSDSRRGEAIEFQLEATDNLAGIYKELGDYQRAFSLLSYSYDQKKEKLPTNDPARLKSQILLGQIHYAMNEYTKAEQYLHQGLDAARNTEGDYLFWQADACNSLALLYDKLNDLPSARKYYHLADSLYESSLRGEYDAVYLEFNRNASLFHAEQKDNRLALQIANKAYRYVLETQGEKSLTTFYQLLNLSEVNFRSGYFNEALDYSKKGLSVVNDYVKGSSNLLDSIQIELKKPKAILYKVKAEYQLLSSKDVQSLSALLTQLQEGLTILEKRKTVVNDPKDITIVMADHRELLEFVKKITLELYRLTNDQSYLDQLIGLHESGIYLRIRSRLDKSENIRFAGLSSEAQQQEQKLKSAITASLDGNGSHDEKMDAYFKAIENWNQFQEKLRKEYPHYYKMRYGSIFKPLTEITKSIPENTTLIRYFFIDEDLFALVGDRDKSSIVPLDAKNVNERIALLSRFDADALTTGGYLNDLYRWLWAPLRDKVKNKKLIIIPDRQLYNLSFELLTPAKVNTFRDLSKGSLLAEHIISYQYSLFILDRTDMKQEKMAGNFVAFAPGFSDKVKDEYRAAAKNLTLDNGYLSLLPQPFTMALVMREEKSFGGTSYVNGASTEESFKKNAGQHKIIHIGTHAEANDRFPEFSRLIFAKQGAMDEEANSLYVSEIYNCNMDSWLTVLTACESGKPGYQDGEGMISMAHAFNYAGSQSILTGLWKIDEQASAMIVETFYENLRDGMSKDEALQQAKLSYLEKSDGRMLHPQYWAGLILMGDTSPVELGKNNRWWWIGGIVLAIICILFIANKLYGSKRQ